MYLPPPVRRRLDARLDRAREEGFRAGVAHAAERRSRERYRYVFVVTYGRSGSTLVQGLLKVEDGVSPHLTTGQLLISLIGYSAVYVGLASAMFYLTRKYAIAGPEAALHESEDVIPAYGSPEEGEA